MSAIQELWDGKVSEEVAERQRLVRRALQGQTGEYICPRCGASTPVDIQAGCVTCKTCGGQDCAR